MTTLDRADDRKDVSMSGEYEQSLIDFIAKFEEMLEREVDTCKELHKRYRDLASSSELNMVTGLLHNYRVYKKEIIRDPEKDETP